jgi:hypothetical protein
LQGGIRGDQEAIEKTKLRQAVSATVDELLVAYDKSPADASLTTRTQNKHALRQILRQHANASGSDPITVIDDQLARKWFTAAKQAALPLENDQRAQLTIYNTANSRFQQAASLFSGVYRTARATPCSMARATSSPAIGWCASGRSIPGTPS